MGTLTALQIVQEFAGLRGLPVPSALVGATDKSTAQYRSVLNEVVRKLQGYKWESQKIRATWTAVATSDQGALTTLFPGFESLIYNTGWATTRKIPLIGPLTDSEWATQQALSLVGPPYKFWISQGHIYITPVPTAGETYSMIYQSEYGFYSGGAAVPGLLVDSDTLLFPDDVVLKGFEARWKKVKGEPYLDDEGEFLDLIAKRKAPTLPTHQLDVTLTNVQPRIYIPVGDWPV